MHNQRKSDSLVVISQAVKRIRAHRPEVGLAGCHRPVHPEPLRVVRLEGLLPEAHLNGELGGLVAGEDAVVGVVEDGAGHAGGVLHATEVGDGAHVGRLAGKINIIPKFYSNT